MREFGSKKDTDLVVRIDDDMRAAKESSIVCTGSGWHLRSNACEKTHLDVRYTITTSID